MWDDSLYPRSRKKVGKKARKGQSRRIPQQQQQQPSLIDDVTAMIETGKTVKKGVMGFVDAVKKQREKGKKDQEEVKAKSKFSLSSSWSHSNKKLKSSKRSPI